MTDIQTWLEAHGLGKYAQAFIAQDIGLDVLPELSEADLKELGVASLGERKRLLKAIAQLTSRDAGALVERSPAAVPASAPSVPASPGPEEGERRHASVMFSDLTGYTALNEAFDPEEVEAIMGRVKRIAVAVIERHGGRVNQFVGDEVMAMFGVPVARRDDPQRAVRAALELHHEVDLIAAGLAEKLGRRLSMHTGLHSGLVVARRSDSRAGDYTLTGDTVNTAARLRGLAKPGELVVSPQVWQQVSDYFEAQAGAPIELKGKERPLVPWRIMQERAVHRTGSRPLVGRAEEMQQFNTLAQACVQRHKGRVIFVRGDPGMGKSRLVTEFMDSAREQGLDCHGTAILDFGARTGHDAMRRLVQSLLGLDLDADAASRAEAIARFAAADPMHHAAYLYDMLDVPAPAPVRALLSAIDVPVRQKASLDALCELLKPSASAAPLLLLVEDIHWADAWTLKQLAALAAWTTHHALVLLMTTRFGGDPSIGEWRSALHGLPVSSIDLGPLATEDALRLAAGAASMSEALLRSCVERAEGNPLFLEQLLLNAGDESAGQLPGSIQALIQARMDRLSPSDKNALQAAAVWGSRVPLTALRHLVNDPSFDARALIEQFLLRPDGEALEFSHALIRDGAYGSLLHATRRQLHLAAAQWIEPQDVALAAEHYERAEDQRAADTYRRASEDLAAQFKFTEALALVERGLALPGDTSVRFCLHLAHAHLLRDSLRGVDALKAADAALLVAQTGAARAFALIVSASCMRLLDRLGEGLSLLDEAQPLAEQAGLALALSELHHLRGNLQFGLGRVGLCLQSHERALEWAIKAGSAEAQAAALGGIGDATYAQGRVRTAHGMFQQCLALAREHGLLRVEVSYLVMLGWTSIYLMDMAGSLEATAQGIELARRVAHQRTEMLAQAQRAMTLGWILGKVSEAMPHLERGLEIAHSLGGYRFEAMNWTFRAMLALREGDREAACAHATKALDLAGEGGLSFVGAQNYGTLARAAVDQAARKKAREQGEQQLAGSALSHSHFIFYDMAVQSSLDDQEWQEAERFCDLLAAYIAPEPFTWGEYVVARGRALCRAGRGEFGAELLAELKSLRAKAEQSHSLVFLPGLDAAIEQMRRQ